MKLLLLLSEVSSSLSLRNLNFQVKNARVGLVGIEENDVFGELLSFIVCFLHVHPISSRPRRPARVYTVVVAKRPFPSPFISIGSHYPMPVSLPMLAKSCRRVIWWFLALLKNRAEEMKKKEMNNGGAKKRKTPVMNRWLGSQRSKNNWVGRGFPRGSGKLQPQRHTVAWRPSHRCLQMRARGNRADQVEKCGSAEIDR
jgi:hypothetical protein